MSSLLTVAQLSRKHPAFTEASIRSLAQHAQTNGLHEAIKRIGSRIYIEERLFNRWLANTTAKKLNGGKNV